jgi:glycosyltransferase involved in cell wall biosynthesis
MKIGVVSPWFVRCGISSYTFDLAQALSEQGVEVYVIRLNRFGRKDINYFETLATRRIPKVDLILIEHEYGLYEGGEGAFYGTLRQRSGATPVVTTMHSVSIPIPDEIISENSDAVIVHNKFCQERYAHDSTVIPHGVRQAEPVPRDEAKRALGLEGPVVGMFGFVAPYKGYEFAIRQVGMEFPGVTLLAVGGWHFDLETTYIARMKDLANSLAPGQVRWTGWAEKEMLPTYFGAVDVGLYPNRYATESGSLLTMIGYGKCVLANSLAPVREKAAEGALATYSNEGEFVMKLEELLGKPELRGKYEEGARNYAERNSWANIAKRHIELFSELL